MHRKSIDLLATQSRRDACPAEASTPRRATRTGARVAMAFAISGLAATAIGCSGAPDERTMSSAEELINCPIGETLDCEPGLRGKLLCSCINDGPPPPPPPNSCTTTGLTCQRNTIFVSGCQPGVNCSNLVQWSDACVPSSPASFTETVNWGDGTAPQLLASASQGCPFSGCTPAQTAVNYFLNFQHTFAAAGVYPVSVTVNDVSKPEPSCAVKLQVTVAP